MKMNADKSNMYQYEGRRIVLHFSDGTPPLSGRCIAYTPAYDNDPEIASLDIQKGGRYYSIDIPDIDRIDIIE
jgi:hypothetical protein